MKKMCVVLLFFVLLSSLVLAVDKSPEQIEYQSLFTQLNAKANAADPYTTEGARIQECHGKFVMQVASAAKKLEAKMPTRATRVLECVENYCGGTCDSDQELQYQTKCWDEIIYADNQEYYSELLGYARQDEACMGNTGVSVSIDLEESILVADGISKTKATITLLRGGSPAVGEWIGISMVDPDDSVELEGTLSAQALPINAEGQAVVEYLSPPIVDPDFEGTTLKIQVGHSGKQYREDIGLEPAPLIKGKVVDIRGEAFSKVPILYTYYLNPGDFKRTIETDKNGEFVIPGLKDKKAKLFIGQKFENYLTIIKKEVDAPSDLGVVTLATTREFEVDTGRRIALFLIESLEIERSKAIEIVDNINIVYDPSVGGPEFFVSVPRALKTLFMDEWAEMRLPSERYWSEGEWETIFHEYGHVVMRGLAHDEGADLIEGHDVWLKSNPDTAFDEARAHFISLLLLKSTDRYVEDEFTEKMAEDAMASQNANRNEIEGAVTVFWKQEYGAEMDTCPSCVFEDFIRVQDKFQEENGRPPRTLDEWIAAKGALPAKIEPSQNVELLDYYEERAQEFKDALGVSAESEYDEKEDKTTVTKTISNNEDYDLENVIVVEHISKTVATHISQVDILTPGYTVIQADPIVQWKFKTIPAGEEVKVEYKVKGDKKHLIDQETKTIVAPEPKTGIWKYIGIILVLVLIGFGVLMFFMRRNKGEPQDINMSN